MTKKEFEKEIGFTIEYLDISNGARETYSKIKLSNGKTYYGNHFGGGYTITQARKELFSQVLKELTKKYIMWEDMFNVIVKPYSETLEKNIKDRFPYFIVNKEQLEKNIFDMLESETKFSVEFD